MTKPADPRRETFVERLRTARETGDAAALIDTVPFGRFLGITVDVGVEGELCTRLRFDAHLIGNPMVPALHGGAIASLLESTAIAVVLWEEMPEVLPRPVTLTFDYLRPGRPQDVYASATIVRRGRRVCSVRAVAWQQQRDKPIAAASATLLLG